MADQIQVYLLKFDKQLSKYPLAVELEKKTNIPKTHLVGGILSMLSVFLLFNIFGDLIATLHGVVWPTYQSFKAIEKHDKEENTKWLTYWCVFGFMTLIEVFSDPLLYWVPYYYALKAVFVVYLTEFDGANLIYHKILEPFLLAEESLVDSSIGKIKTKASQAASEFKQD
ncbi:ER membrane protein DP1/Yop1 [Rhizoclosmatium sp. JEL0117]|nr:ER membrane protein DP1/Yop1 [Rhizoclosmatium sp. JEL0117]